MTDFSPDMAAFLGAVHPFSVLPEAERTRVAGHLVPADHPAGTTIYQADTPLPGLFVLQKGEVEILDPAAALVSQLGPGDIFGERGLMRDGRAVTTARALRDARVLLLPVETFRGLLAAYPAFESVFRRGRGSEIREPHLSAQKVADLMARPAVAVPADTTVREAARRMRDDRVSALGVLEHGRFAGIVTTRDLTQKVATGDVPIDAPVACVMTRDPVTLSPSELGSDVLHLMLERGIGHVPVVERGALVGMITQTDLTRFQAVSSAQFVRDAAAADSVEALARLTARIPRLLAQLVYGHQAHEIVTRLITDIADTVTRRLLALAEARLGPPPVRYLWLACGSQGRQEQTGVSDQDNCLILDDAAASADMAYFAALAREVSDGLHACGYVYCPGDMMATNPRWCQPLSVWRDYFAGWIARPDPMAQMLASVMFDLRPIGGHVALFDELQAETLDHASRNTIFVAHMVAHAVTHAPPLGLLRGFATIRSGPHRRRIDLKHGGVVPVTDLGRVYALLGRLGAVNTRARLEAAAAAGIISGSGGRDLIEAYDLIARTRLDHQAAQVRAGHAPDNFLDPAALSDFERAHLRDAFVVVRTMQAAVRQARGA